MILLDTHIWLWWLLGDGPLTPKYRQVIDKKAEKAHLALSIISVWEAEMLERKGRIRLEPSFEDWIATATHPSFIKILPLDIPTIKMQRNLPEDFHSDPGDRLIVSTALVHKLPLATFDQRIAVSSTVDVWEP